MVLYNSYVAGFLLGFVPQPNLRIFQYLPAYQRKYLALFSIVISICYIINSAPNTNAYFFENQRQLLQHIEFVVNNIFNGLFKL